MEDVVKFALQIAYGLKFLEDMQVCGVMREEITHLILSDYYLHTSLCC